ncbi:exosortase/archaeosortase family protein [Kiritimatiellaeota bacterium B1221]|nr:exosortase/archaeosortase family protein [Kiritimatiellaeota bacterium B1221]
MKFDFLNKKKDKGTSSLEPRKTRPGADAGYGYYGGVMPVRVPQLSLVDLVAVGVLLLIANAFMIISLFKFYLNFEDYSHAILVPLISAAAAWRVWTLSEEKLHVVGDYWGLPVLLVGLCIQFVALWYEIGLVAGGIVSEYFTAVGLVISIWGLFISFYGVRALRLYWFPLLYLGFMVPGLPGPPEVWLKGALKDVVTTASSSILGMFGYSVYVTKNVIEIPGVVLGVADACSGIRSLWAMLAVAPAAAWFLRLRPFLIALFIPLGIFLAVFQNVIRVVATALLCSWFDMSWASGHKHDMVGGVSFFLSSIVMIILARVLAPPPGKKIETVGSYSSYGVYGTYGMSSGYGYGGSASNAAYHADNDPEAGEEENDDFVSAEQQREYFFSKVSRIRVGVYSLLILMLLGQMLIFQRYAIRNRVQYEIAQQRRTLDVFPGQIGEYKRIYWGELPEVALRILKPTESYVAWYASPDNRHINVIINFWEPVIGFNGSSWAFPHSPDVCFREAGWEIEQVVPLPEEMNDEYEIMFSRLYKNNLSRQMVLYWYNRDEVTRIMNAFINEDLEGEDDRMFEEKMDDRTREEVARSRAAAEEKGDSSYLARMKHMVRSWNRPKDYSRYQYSVGIYVPEQGGVDETIALAQDFALEIRKEIAPFGLKPLQRLDLDNIEASLKRADVAAVAEEGE